MVLTRELFYEGFSDEGGLNKKQIKLLGVSFTKGWKQECIGKDYPEEVIKKFLALRGESKSQRKNTDEGYSDSLFATESQSYEAYTDGSCNNLSPHGEGGAAYIILQDDKIVHSSSKGFIGTTNNRMELIAIVSAVNYVAVGSTITIHTDSRYAMTVLAKNYTITPSTSNTTLIKAFRECAKGKVVKFKWLKGHNGDMYNEMVDKMSDARKEEVRIKNNIPIYSNKNSPKVMRCPSDQACQ